MYLRFNWLSIFFIFMLFVLGGLVRSTGSGMGCPDWPKCFGEYIPPTSEADLPADYETYFKEQRISKTARFISLLKVLGMEEKAREIEESKQVGISHQFNVSKAYVEYINRIAGALTGIIVFICFLFSFTYIRSKPLVLFYTSLGFIAVFLNALLGAVVVHSNLMSGIVTAHFIAAFAAIVFFMLARNATKEKEENTYPLSSKIIANILMILVSSQVILGSQIRELYDALMGSLTFSSSISQLYPNFHIHAALGLVILSLSVYQWISLGNYLTIRKKALFITFLSATQMVFGLLVLTSFSAAISKLFHISFAAAIFVLQFYICTQLIGAYKQGK